MEKYFVLYNPLSKNNKGKENAEKLKDILNDKELFFYDITKIEDYNNFFKNTIEQNNIILCGGDGTINRFANNIKDLSIKNNIYYFATGTGNDFLNDIKNNKNETINNSIYLINKYLQNLPTVIVNNKEYKFINNVGYGIDGYCCEVADKKKLKSNKSANYTAIALKGLFYDYRPTKAKIDVDGQKYEIDKVWLCPTMNGKYYGGGMMAAPGQDRLNNDHTVSTVVMHGFGRLHTLVAFPSIFKGNHVKNKKLVNVLTGKHITVEFDRPTALQIDGETILNVKKYEVICN